MDEFKFDKYLILDSDENFNNELFGKDKVFNFKKNPNAVFALGKNCKMYVTYDEIDNVIKIGLYNSRLKERRVIAESQYDREFINAIAENFMVFNYLVEPRSKFKRTENEVDPDILYMILTNIDKALDCEKPPKGIHEIITNDVYQKAIIEANKAYGKEQREMYLLTEPEIL